MKNHDILLRAATPEDAEAMRGIYAPYVENTAVSFEYAVPSPGEFRGRVERTLEKYPWIAALEDGDIPSKAAFAALSAGLIRVLAALTGEPLTELARMYSAEIEYSDENLWTLFETLGEA